MSEFEKKIVKGCVVFIAVLFLLLAANAFAQAVVVPPPPEGVWYAEKAVLVTSPEGKQWACVLGEFEEPLPAGVSFYDCVPWLPEEVRSWYALPDGSISRRIQ